jgi:hypothetical protein
MSSLNVALCTVFHHSDMRLNGYDVAKNFYKSWEQLNYKVNLIILDNESTCEFDFVDTKKCTFIRIDNQLESGGITGAWNRLCREAIKIDSDIIMGFNDDIILNDSLQYLAEATIDDNKLYVPVTNGMLPPWVNQISNKRIEGYRKVTNFVNGFFMSFTSNFWKHKSINNDLFIKKRITNSDKIDEWQGQELMLWVWKDLHGTMGEIVGDCWLHHEKLRSWKKARDKYKI